VTPRPILSIIIPCYNYGTLLPRAIASVFLQSINSIEVLIVDDGSTDNSSQIIDQLQSIYGPKLIALRKENGGLSSARNFGIDNSRGTYILFLDADDELLPNSIEILLKEIQASPHIGMLVGSHITRFDNGSERMHPSIPFPSKADTRVRAYLLEKKISIASSYAAIHRKVFAQYRYNEELRNAEDIPMFAYILANYECAALPDYIAKMHRHRDSLRHNLKHASTIGMKLVDEIFAPERMPFQSLKKDYTTQRSLSLFRTFYQARKYDDALKYYYCALNNDKKTIFRISYARKAIFAHLKKFVNGNAV
jgi:glycosyltransferase involved in cell wall biosynthesis